MKPAPGTCTNCYVPLNICHCSMSKTRGLPCARCVELEEKASQAENRLTAQEKRTLDAEAHAQSQLEREAARVQVLQHDVERLTDSVRRHEADAVAHAQREVDLSVQLAKAQKSIVKLQQDRGRVRQTADSEIEHLKAQILQAQEAARMAAEEWRPEQEAADGPEALMHKVLLKRELHNVEVSLHHAEVSLQSASGTVIALEQKVDDLRMLLSYAQDTEDAEDMTTLTRLSERVGSFEEGIAPPRTPHERSIRKQGGARQTEREHLQGRDATSEIDRLRDRARSHAPGGPGAQPLAPVNSGSLGLGGLGGVNPPPKKSLAATRSVGVIRPRRDR